MSNYTIALELYPERQEPNLGRLDRAADKLVGMINQRLHGRAARFQRVVERVNQYGRAVADLREDDIAKQIQELRYQLRSTGLADEPAARALQGVDHGGVRLGDRPSAMDLVVGHDQHAFAAGVASDPTVSGPWRGTAASSITRRR